jgi:transposase
MRAMTNEKRELIIAAKKRKEKGEDIAVWINVSLSSVNRIWSQYKKTNSISPKVRPGRTPRLNDAKIEEIKASVKKQPDLTLDELIERLELPIKKSRLSVILIKMGLSYKKNSVCKRAIKS